MDLVMALEVLNYIPQNMYQFILLDKQVEENGVQWGMKTKERWIRRILLVFSQK